MEEIDDCQITVTFRVHPVCGHKEFVNNCLWCADARRVYNELLDLPRKKYSGVNIHTKVTVVEAHNPIE